MTTAPRIDRDARVERLRRTAQERSANAATSARRAIMTLHAHGRPISIRTVAEEAGVSQSFLTKNAELRAQIDAYKQIGTGPTTPNHRTGDDVRTTASLRTQLVVAAKRLKELEDQNKQLREENANLRGALLEERRSNRRSQP